MKQLTDFSSICVIIPTINESTFEEVISAVRAQTKNAEIVVTGFGNSAVIAQKYHATFIDTRQKTPKAICLNMAIKHSHRDKFILLDADAIPANGWGEKMANGFSEGHVVFSAGVVPENENIWMKVYNLSTLHEFFVERPPEKRIHIATFSAGVTREIFDKVGLFDPAHFRCDDYEWSLRCTQAGIQPFFYPTAVVLHKPIEKNSLLKVLRYWVLAGADTITVRIKYQGVLNTPKVLRNRFFILFFSPIISIIPTLRVIKTIPTTMRSNLHLLPLIYLTKLAWCWGAYKSKSVGAR